jgi:hypothetical protein
MTSGLFNQFKVDILSKKHNLAASGDTINIYLMGTGYTNDYTKTKWSDISANETTGTGYVSASVLANQSVSLVSTTANFTVSTTTTTSYTTATFSAIGIVLANNTYQISSSPALICYLDFGGTKSVTGGTFTITWTSVNIIALT